MDIKKNVNLNPGFQSHSKKLSERMPEVRSLDKKNKHANSEFSINITRSLKKVEKTTAISKPSLGKLFTPKLNINQYHSSTTNNRLKNSYSGVMQSSRLMVINKKAENVLMTPKIAFNCFKAQLTDYEKIEIFDYTDIYYIGKICNKLKPSSEKPNYGFDDERGDYLLVAGDQIAYRYEVIKMLGKGNFGQVVLCIDHKNRENVALKLVRNKKRFNQQALVEIKILQTLRENDTESKHHIVRIRGYFVFRGHIILVFDKLEMNLFELLHLNKFEGFSIKLIRKFTHQLLLCLKFTYSMRVIHCDLKPENVMLASKNSSKISVIDFGSSCFHSERLYTYIQSRFYRAPEIILGIPYTTAIDMWSLGCIVAEFFTGLPLFMGESEHEQLLWFMEALDLPPASVMAQATRSKLFFEKTGEPKFIPNKNGEKKTPGTKKLSQTLNGAPENLIDFVTKCLDWDPQNRLKPSEALKHPFITEKLKKTNDFR